MTREEFLRKTDFPECADRSVRADASRFGPERYTSGAKDRPAVSSIFMQPFANYNLRKGLAAGVSMEVSGDWKAAEQWNAPLLFSVSKVTLLGKQPVNLGVAAGPTVISPSYGASWRFRLSATFLFPK